MPADNILSILSDDLLSCHSSYWSCCKYKDQRYSLVQFVLSVAGAGYILFFAAKMGVWNFLSNIINIVNADKSHGSWNVGKAFSLFADSVGLWLIGCIIITFVTSIVMHYMRNNRVKQIFYGFFRWR